ncbi:hypothetical protein [Rhizobium sp. CNPSo 3490]|uniref:hypothetical protein n=1 Tax=Rhizobium sp. CNPSo 3490 TaxID=3021407 RepID=UPI00254F576B|nr:hypothetical protein [Rhizobium sp. CNPSo 3490]MDK4733948.1 hypothetical protein [Rhizobium sp. CNPSo 3490]
MLLAARLVADYAKELGADAERQETRPVYDHMGALLADSVLQAGLNYNSVVRPRVEVILAQFPQCDRTSGLLPVVGDGQTATFLNWTHPEKIGRFESLVRFLDGNSIETVLDLGKKLQRPGFVELLREVRGVGPKTVDYMGCLVGLDSVAVDRHVRTFARRVGVLNDDYDFLRSVFCCAADLLSLSRRQFDAWVWRRESSLSSHQIEFSF